MLGRCAGAHCRTRRALAAREDVRHVVDGDALRFDRVDLVRHDRKSRCELVLNDMHLPRAGVGIRVRNAPCQHARSRGRAGELASFSKMVIGRSRDVPASAAAESNVK